MLDVYVNGISIDMGRQGENDARNIYFDLSDLISVYGEGTATLVHMRPSDKLPYVCETVRTDDFLIWVPSNIDTAYAGSGKCELRWVVGETLAKSIIYTTKITASITAGETIPDQYQSWYEQLLAQIQAYNIASDQIAANTSQITANTSDIAVLDGRMDEFTTLTEGSTTGDAELADGRVGYNGTTYANIGGAIRAQVGDIHDLINSLTLGIDEDDGLLYLYVNGVKQGDGIEVTTGTRYTITYTLATGTESSNNSRSVPENRAYTTTISTTSSEYQIDTITVTMGGTDITSSVLNNYVISIPSVTGDVTITVTAMYFPKIVLSTGEVSISSGNTAQFGVKLEGAPAQPQTVTIIPGDNVTTDVNTLSFTSENYDTYQYVTVTGSDIEGTSYTQVTVRNGDPLMTDYAVSVIVSGAQYDDVVDMTIPAGQVTASLNDFTFTEYAYIYLTKYNGDATNLKVPSATDLLAGTEYAGKEVSFNNACFSGNTTLQYLEIDPSIKHANNDKNFQGMTSLIGLKYRVSDFTNFNSEFKGDYNFAWWDGMELNTNCTSIVSFLHCNTTPNTSLRYMPDLSSFTKVTSWLQAFWGCTALVKFFGMPTAYDSACNMNSAFYGCTSLKKAVIGANVTIAASTFRFASNAVGALEAVDVYATGLTDSNSGGMFTNNRSGAVVRAVAESDTYEFLQTFVTSGNITLTDFNNQSVPLIVAWGDSTTSAGTSWTCWPDRLITKLGATNFGLKNEAVSGEWTTSTSARQGGNTPVILESFTIPATGSVLIPSGTVGTKDGRIFERYTSGHTGGGQFRPYNSFSPCTISDVKGTFTRTGGGYTFTRIEDGTAVTVPANTYFYSDADDTLSNSNVIMLINLGINSGWNNLAGDTSYSTGVPYPNDLLTQVQYMVDHFLAKGGTKYIVCGPSAGKFIENDDYLALVQEYEGLAATAFGDHWLNLRTYGITYGLSQNGLTATDEDTTRMAAGRWPSSLLHGNGTDDLTHPNSYGANTQMLAFYEKGVELGYWT